jgi:hypothetical protein
LSELFKHGEIFDHSELSPTIMCFIGHFGKEVSLFKTCHYRPFLDLLMRFVDIEIILSDKGRFEISIDHDEIVFVLMT